MCSSHLGLCNLYKLCFCSFSACVDIGLIRCFIALVVMKKKEAENEVCCAERETRKLCQNNLSKTFVPFRLIFIFLLNKQPDLRGRKKLHTKFTHSPE